MRKNIDLRIEIFESLELYWYCDRHDEWFFKGSARLIQEMEKIYAQINRGN